jgi:hypothetical protein
VTGCIYVSRNSGFFEVQRATHLRAAKLVVATGGRICDGHHPSICVVTASCCDGCVDIQAHAADFNEHNRFYLLNLGMFIMPDDSLTVMYTSHKRWAPSKTGMTKALQDLVAIRKPEKVIFPVALSGVRSPDSGVPSHG